MRKAIVGMVAGVGLALGAVAPASAETLASALEGAYRTSGLLDQNRAVLRAADEDLAQAVAALRPVLSWSGSVTRSFGKTRNPITEEFVGSATNSANIGLSASILLYSGGRRILRFNAAKESILAARASLVAVEQQVLLRAVEAFMDVREAVETVALRRNNVRVIQEELRAARDRFEVGEVTRTDVAAAEARLAEARSLLATAEGTLEVARAEYEAAIGRAPGDLVPPASDPRLPGTVQEAQVIARRNHPSLEQLQHQVTVAELAIEIAEAAMKPSLSLSTGYSFNETFDSAAGERGGSISLNAEGPIYQGGELSSLVRQAMANRDQVRAQLYEAVRSIEQNVANAYAQLRVSRASLAATDEQVRAATVAFRGVREEATLGARTTLDVLDAEQELLDARATRITAQVNETVAAYAVLSSVGRLTADALQLNVPRYDPEEYYDLVKTAPTLSQQGEDLDRVLRALGKE
ncbi:TolC family outer membrane protein [Salipiger mucosus]|uniref:Type I secretion outer membrane protein, TolC n=1 Tax=Salipiger mucosus DSM 16094 TaxID=1123237 RepID=S9SGH8_9RHOB|nr:TolC family outer membrane protein [Salipiger mucosus]EPX85399.1 Type I secretion outer membrane protein, TolC precursor [Salipiger mucosus DSM 16094]